MSMLIAEDLVLLLLDDESGRLRDATYLDTGIGGALLVELALAGNVEVVTTEGWWSRARVVPTSAPLPSDPTLRAALETVQDKERTAQDLVGRLGKKRRKALLARLEDAGILRREEGRVMGLFPTTRWPAVDSSHEADVRGRSKTSSSAAPGPTSAPRRWSRSCTHWISSTGSSLPTGSLPGS